MDLNSLRGIPVEVLLVADELLSAVELWVASTPGSFGRTVARRRAARSVVRLIAAVGKAKASAVTPTVADDCDECGASATWKADAPSLGGPVHYCDDCKRGRAQEASSGRLLGRVTFSNWRPVARAVAKENPDASR